MVLTFIVFWGFVAVVCVLLTIKDAVLTELNKEEENGKENDKIRQEGRQGNERI